MKRSFNALAEESPLLATGEKDNEHITDDELDLAELGTLDTSIKGVQYYSGIVNRNEGPKMS